MKNISETCLISNNSFSHKRDFLKENLTCDWNFSITPPNVTTVISQQLSPHLDSRTFHLSAHPLPPSLTCNSWHEYKTHWLTLAGAVFWGPSKIRFYILYSTIWRKGSVYHPKSASIGDTAQRIGLRYWSDRYNQHPTTIIQFKSWEKSWTSP